MKNQKRQMVNKNLNKQVRKSESQKKIEKIMDIYESVPNFIDKSTKSLLTKYSL